jgi:predicted O-methyltransferase YrrM
VESYDSLRQMLDFDRPLPVVENWSAAADFLYLIARDCLARKPSVIVECSSGLTTLVLAGCCRLNGCGQVYSLENSDEFAVNTRHQLDAFSLADYATVLHAPLENTSLGGDDYLWYRLDTLYADEIDMLVIDGPPGFLQKNSRYPALPLLYERLSDGSVVFMDDAAREDEIVIVNMWRDMFPSAISTYIATERGCAVLRINRQDC